MQPLLLLQSLELNTKPLTQEQEADILRLRDKINRPTVHSRSLSTGGLRTGKSVTIAHTSGRSECHRRVPSGVLASLAYTIEILLYDDCDRYLHLQEKRLLNLDLQQEAQDKSSDGQMTKEDGRTRRLEPSCV